MGKKQIIQGALLLSASNLLSRLLGFVYRITMTKAIGAEGMGLYQLIMPLYALSWTLTSAGLTTTLSHLTARELALGQKGNVKRILHLSLLLSLCLSVLVAAGLFFLAPFLSVQLLQDARAVHPLQIISCCIPMMALGSCMRGYFYGLQKHAVPAASQLLEQLVRLSAIFILSTAFSLAVPQQAVCAAAVGIVLGETASFLLTLLCLKTQPASPTAARFSRRHCLSLILSMAIPLSATRIFGSLLHTAENILIPQRLSLFSQSTNALADFGRLTGMAMPLRGAKGKLL